MKTCLAIIPARGGSKGIPGKNIRSVAGKPLIAWTILAARGSGMFVRIVVTTDSPEIADAAREFRAEIPFMRPAELALDDTPGTDPVLHAVRWLEEMEGFAPDLVMLLQPTSPLRSAQDIRDALNIAEKNDANAVVSVTPVKEHPYWTKSIDDQGRLQDFFPTDKPITRRQDLPPLFALNGAIYLVRREVLLEQGTFFPDNTYALIMPAERSLDVDTPWELHLADLVLRDQSNHESR